MANGIAVGFAFATFTHRKHAMNVLENLRYYPFQGVYIYANEKQRYVLDNFTPIYGKRPIFRVEKNSQIAFQEPYRNQNGHSLFQNEHHLSQLKNFSDKVRVEDNKNDAEYQNEKKEYKALDVIEKIIEKNISDK